jgi:hypothetical protein
MIASQNPKVRYRPFTLSDLQIFTRIWIRPKGVLGYINEYRYDTYTITLLVLAAIAGSLELAAANSFGEHMTLPFLLVITSIVGGIVGTIVFYVYATVMSWTGEWVAGLGSTNSIIRVFAYSLVPIVFVLLLIIAKILVFGRDLFQEEMKLANYDSGTATFYIVASSVEVALAAWSLYLTVVGVGQAQRISFGKSALNVLLSGSIIISIIAILSIPFFYFES